MGATITPDKTQIAMLGRLLRPDQRDFSPVAAKSLLKIKFELSDQERMTDLSQKASAGTLTFEEQLELQNYALVCQFLDMLHCKARLCLKKHAVS